MVCDRLVDITVINDLEEVDPVYGCQDQIFVSLEIAVEPIQSIIHSFVNDVKITKEYCYYPNEHNLSRDQSISVYLYTIE